MTWVEAVGLVLLLGAAWMGGVRYGKARADQRASADLLDLAERQQASRTAYHDRLALARLHASRAARDHR